jgi:hypothetical protein
MAVPERIQRAGRHQIDGLLPLPQQGFVDGKPVDDLARHRKGRSELLRAADRRYLSIPLAHVPALPQFAQLGQALFHVKQLIVQLSSRARRSRDPGPSHSF